MEAEWGTTTKKPKTQHICVYSGKKWGMWLNANSGVCSTWEGGGGWGGGGGHLEVCSFSQAPPRWVNLLSFLLITLQRSDCSCHFSPSLGPLAHHEQQWWVASERNLLAGLGLLLMHWRACVLGCAPTPLDILFQTSEESLNSYLLIDSACSSVLVRRACVAVTGREASVQIPLKTLTCTLQKKQEFVRLRGTVQGVVLPPKWRQLCSRFKLVLGESLGAVFRAPTCSTMTGMRQSQSREQDARRARRRCRALAHLKT